MPRHATLTAIERAECASAGVTGEEAFDVFELANAYYGWHRPNLAESLLQGVGGKTCGQLDF